VRKAKILYNRNSDNRKRRYGKSKEEKVNEEKKDSGRTADGDRGECGNV
jgi:hypothetical protein